MGAISQKNSQLPSYYLSYPSPTQDPVASTKTIGRRRTYNSAMAPSLIVPNTCKQESGSTQLRLPTRGCFHNKIRHCPLSLSPTRRPPKTPLLHRNESTAVRQRYGFVFVRVYQLQARIRFNPARDADMGAISQKKLATALVLSFLPVAHPKPRFSTK